MRLGFADCELDTVTRVLTRGGAPVALSPKAYALLALLAERRPGAVSHDDLRDAVWPDVEIGGTQLARLVNEVRAAVGDEAGQPRVIRTIQRFGYAFCAEAVEINEEEGARAGVSCALNWEGRHIPLPPGHHDIGRALDAFVTVPEKHVSKHHARIVVTPAGARLEDLGSRNGTYVNGTRVSGSIALANGDRLVVGPASFTFCQADDEKTDTM